MVEAIDVAAALIERAGPMDPLKIQKLVYFADAWCLAWYNRPLFTEELEAWAYGPVTPSLYQAYKSYGRELVAEPVGGRSDRLSERQTGVVLAVIHAYVGLSSVQLMRLSHDAPWRRARSADPGWGNEPMSNDEIADHYRGASRFGPADSDIAEISPEALRRAASGDNQGIATVFEEALGVKVKNVG